MFVSLVAAVIVAAACTCAHAQFDKPFVIVDIGQPPGMALIQDELTVTDINASGAIVGYFPASTSEWNGFLWYDGVWTVFDLGTGTDSTAIMGIDDNFDLIGWIGPKNGSKDCVILNDINDDGDYIDQDERMDVADAIGVNRNSGGACVGNDDSLGGTGWVCSDPTTSHELLGISTQEAWATNVGTGSTFYIVGTANDSSGDAKPVTWEVVNSVPQSPTNLFPPVPPYDDYEGRATAVTVSPINNEDEPTIVGYRDNAGSLTGYMWVADGNGSWTIDTIPDMTLPFDVNDSEEVVGQGPGGQWDPRIYSLSADETYDLSALVQTWFVDRQVDPDQFEVTAINNSGLIAGTGKLQGAAPGAHVVCFVVPYDCNNDGVSDFRERLLEPGDPMIPGNDWLLADCKKLRPGLHAPGAATNANVAQNVNNVSVVRFMNRMDDLEAAVCDTQACNLTSIDFTRWGANFVDELTTYTDMQKEIIITIRSAENMESNDRLPANPTEEQDWLDTIEAYAGKFARCIDYVQTGNEIFAEDGGYYLTDFDCGATTYTGLLKNIDGDCFAAACTAVIDWHTQQAEAALRGSALAGRPLLIIAGGTAYETATKVAAGDADSTDLDNLNNRAAFGYRCIVDFANEINAMVDVHFHFSDSTEADTVAADMKTPPGSTNVPQAEFITALEYGPVPSPEWWAANRDNTDKFVDTTNNNMPTGIKYWDEGGASTEEWLEAKETSGSGYHDSNASLPSGFLVTGFSTLDSNGYRHVCYGPTRQEGSLAKFWIAAIHPSAITETSLDPNKLTRWKSRYETAAQSYITALGAWEPHPDECTVDCTSCP